MTTCASAGQRSRTASARSSSAASATNSTFASLCASTYASWSAVLAGYTGTIAPPAAWMPRAADAHATRLPAKIAARSPGFRPTWRRYSATLRICCANSPQVTASHALRPGSAPAAPT
jgi:hypothetical protein